LVTINTSRLSTKTSSGADYPWSKTVAELEKSNMINIVPYEINLDYDYWDYRTHIKFHPYRNY